jgi:hypothetical protein
MFWDLVAMMIFANSELALSLSTLVLLTERKILNIFSNAKQTQIILISIVAHCFVQR